MEAALAVAALGDSQFDFGDADLDSSAYHHNINSVSESHNLNDQPNHFTHTSEHQNVLANQQAFYSQGQLPCYDHLTDSGTDTQCIINEQSETADSQVKEETSNQQEPQNASDQTEQPDAPVIDIVINNVVCSFATRCHLNLKRIALEGANVIYKKESGMVSMKIRHPKTTASIWSSGKITCTGATSEEEAKIAARKFSRFLQRLGFRVRLSNYRVVNVLGTCSFPFPINITNFSRDHRGRASYEPELHPGVTYKIVEPKATLKIFSTGSITVTAPRVANVQSAIEHIFPLVLPYRMESEYAPTGAKLHLMPAKRTYNKPKPKKNPADFNYDSDENVVDSDDSDDFDSDVSQD